VKVGDSPVNLDVVGGSVWVPCDRDDTLWRLDARTGKVVEHLATAKNPAVVAGAEGDVWASMYDAAAVWRIHAS
jgi:streptogramin lyase